MDAIFKFPARASCYCPGINQDIKKRLAYSFSPSKRTCKLLNKIEIQQSSICFKKNVLYKYWDSGRISARASKSPKSRKNSSSPAETVDLFYTCINDKNIELLDECISKDAFFYDYSFIKPFEGKKVCRLYLNHTYYQI